MAAKKAQKNLLQILIYYSLKSATTAVLSELPVIIASANATTSASVLGNLAILKILSIKSCIDYVPPTTTAGNGL